MAIVTCMEDVIKQSTNGELVAVIYTARDRMLHLKKENRHIFYDDYSYEYKIQKKILEAASNELSARCWKDQMPEKVRDFYLSVLASKYGYWNPEEA